MQPPKGSLVVLNPPSSAGPLYGHHSTLFKSMKRLLQTCMAVSVLGGGMGALRGPTALSYGGRLRPPSFCHLFT